MPRKGFTKAEIKQLKIINSTPLKDRSKYIRTHMLLYNRTHSSVINKLHRLKRVNRRSVNPIAYKTVNTDYKTVNTDRTLRFNIKSLTINNNEVIIKY